VRLFRRAWLPWSALGSRGDGGRRETHLLVMRLICREGPTARAGRTGTMVRTWLLVGLALANALVAPAPAAAQTTVDDCAAAQRLVQQLNQRLPADQSTMVPTGWTLPPYPWIAGLRPYPYPYVP